MLIDKSYFVGKLNIPNTDKAYISERLDLFIIEKQETLLRDLFGYEMYKLFEQQAIDQSDIPDRWKDLMEGAEYTCNGKLKKWDGLLFQRQTLPISLIANYVYWHWIKDQDSQTVGLGEVKTKGENAVNVSPAGKMVTAWNSMSEMIYSLIDFLTENKETYPEWDDAGDLRRKYRHRNTFGI